MPVDGLGLSVYRCLAAGIRQIDLVSPERSLSFPGDVGDTAVIIIALLVVVVAKRKPKLSISDINSRVLTTDTASIAVRDSNLP